ncbi:MAG: hypothetical protein E6Q06_03920 [Candidatus Moraniibacteriota bacterium]|nr:MAG: hypothetical protein E6Q06_03920 [Candidatus Moranbacteria bacterium]
MDWFKQKKASTIPSRPADPLQNLIRTMEDDLSGRGISADAARAADSSVSFHPNTTGGAPFFTAPGVTEVDAESNDRSGSPFLRESIGNTAVPPVELPVFDPPLARPAAVPSSERPGPSEVASQESSPVAFRTSTLPAAGPSFRASLSSLSAFLQALKPIFRDRKILLVISIAVTLLLIILAFGTYFWWQSNISMVKPEVRVESPSLPQPAIQPELASQTRYFSDQPNILSFDTETVTAEQIQSALLQAGDLIRKDSLSGPIEFLVRDQKLNPLALSRFAYLAKLNVSADLLSTLDESFSLYIFMDSGRPRIVLVASIKDIPAFEAGLKKNEKDLALAVAPLFLDVTTAPKTNLTFRDGSYLGRPVRFANIDPALGLSVDYAVRDQQWVLGTSKDSLRSVLDKNGL